MWNVPVERGIDGMLGDVARPSSDWVGRSFLRGGFWWAYVGMGGHGSASASFR